MSVSEKTGYFEETGIGFRAAGGISRFVAHLLLLLCYYQVR